MYEAQTFSAILQRMLDRVSSDVDKREGSMIYDALAPAAAELMELYAELDIQMNQSFADTASDVYLRRRAADFGVKWQEATKAHRLGLFYGSEDRPMNVPIGSRFSLASLNYVVKEVLATGQALLECEAVGAIGNMNYGTMLPIDYVKDLVRAELADVLIPGEDDETDEVLRERLFAEVRSPGTSGNKSDYMRWALSIAGVGAVQVEPLWNGPGTVRVVIIDSEKKPASLQLLQEVQNYIAPVSEQGEGAAPIGADVTIAAAEAITISVIANVVHNGSATLAAIQAGLEVMLENYLQSIAFGNDPSPKYVRIGSLLLDIPGVIDFSDLLVNGGTANIAITAGQAAVIGTVSLVD